MSGCSDKRGRKEWSEDPVLVQVARQTSHEYVIGTNRQDRERNWWRGGDIALSDGRGYMVAGSQTLAPEHDGELASTLRTN